MQHIKDIDVNSLQISVIKSGWESLDKYLLLKDHRSELIIIGARPSVGKSALMFQLAANVSQNYPVQVFSLEMDKEQILSRLIAKELNVSMNYIQSGRVPQKDLERAHAKFSKSHYYIDDRAGLDVHDLIIAAKEQHQKMDTKLIVIDYLQLLRVKRGHSKDDEIGTITNALKTLAKDLKVPIVVGSQLNRQCEIRGAETGDYRPVLSDLRESGNIEQDADMVLLLHREARYSGLRPGEADIIIAKNRSGPTGQIVMHFTEAQCAFLDQGPRNINANSSLI